MNERAFPIQAFLGPDCHAVAVLGILRTGSAAQAAPTGTYDLLTFPSCTTWALASSGTVGQPVANPIRVNLVIDGMQVSNAVGIDPCLPPPAIPATSTSLLIMMAAAMFAIGVAAVRRPTQDPDCAV